MGNDTPAEQIEFRAVAPYRAGDLRGLDQAIQRLNQLDALLKGMQGRLAGFSTNAAFKMSAAQYAGQIKTKGKISPAQLAAQLGFADPKDVQRVAADRQRLIEQEMTKYQRKIDAIAAKQKPTAKRATPQMVAFQREIDRLEKESPFTSPRAGLFLKNPKQAGIFAEQYAREALRMRGISQVGMAALLGGAAGNLPAGTKGPVSVGGTATLGPGKISLVIPANRISATLGQGAVKVSGQSSVVSGQKGGGKGNIEHRTSNIERRTGENRTGHAHPDAAE